MQNQESVNPWWVDRWLDLLQSYRFKKRLERGWTYAREGKVLQIEFQSGRVWAQVQGTEAEPYQLAIWLEPFTPEDWQYVIQTLGLQANYTAQLLAGEMPSDIEQVFVANGLNLFPFQLSEVQSKCSCPDPQNPCKHVAAVYYLLGEHFRADPFMLFQLRGSSRREIIAALRSHRHRQLESVPPPLLSAPETVDSTTRADDFWGDLRQLIDFAANFAKEAITASPANTSEFLGPLPLTAMEAQQVRQFLARVYQAQSPQQPNLRLQNATKSIHNPIKPGATAVDQS